MVQVQVLVKLYDGRDMYIICYIKNNYMFRPFSLALKRAETWSCSLCNKLYTYLYHHIVVLDKYIHSNLVYYKHNGDDEPYDYAGTSSCCYINTNLRILQYSHILR